MVGDYAELTPATVPREVWCVAAQRTQCSVVVFGSDCVLHGLVQQRVHAQHKYVGAISEIAP